MNSLFTPIFISILIAIILWSSIKILIKIHNKNKQKEENELYNTITIFAIINIISSILVFGYCWFIYFTNFMHY